MARDLCDLLPPNNLERPPMKKTTDSKDRSCDALDSIIPDDPAKPYDVLDVIAEVLDDGGFMEVQADWVRTSWSGSVTGGHTVGVVANQPKVLAGCLDIDASDKAARFVRFCDAFNIPILTFEDRSRFPSRNEPRMGWHHPPRCETPLRLCRSHRSQTDGHPAQACGGAYDAMSSSTFEAELATPPGRRLNWR